MWAAAAQIDRCRANRRRNKKIHRNTIRPFAAGCDEIRWYCEVNRFKSKMFDESRPIHVSTFYDEITSGTTQISTTISNWIKRFHIITLKLPSKIRMQTSCPSIIVRLCSSSVDVKSAEMTGRPSIRTISIQIDRKAAMFWDEFSDECENYRWHGENLKLNQNQGLEVNVSFHH